MARPPRHSTAARRGARTPDSAALAAPPDSEDVGGTAAGRGRRWRFTKPTTGGGIFYSLLTASLAAEVLARGLAAGRLDEAFLAGYERRWQERLGQELRVADWLRSAVTN